jgi:pimeloyl-ACP methyl ester carboxylesterase
MNAEPLAPSRRMRVTGLDGTAIAVQEWGNPAGQPLLLLHGFCQSHLSWTRQLGDAALAARFRMVTCDLRGHGDSDKPLAAEAYAEDALWAGDLAAVLAATGLERPLVVAWSYAGRALGDYFRTHGTGGFAGINYVNARCSAAPELFGPDQVHLKGMRSDEIAVNVAATRGFLRACFARQPEVEVFETMLGFNMAVPAAIRRHVLGRPDETEDMLAAIACPVLATHGRRDAIVLPAMSAFIAASAPGAALSIYESCGHSPFFEDAPRFNAELAAFADTCFGR